MSGRTCAPADSPARTSTSRWSSSSTPGQRPGDHVGRAGGVEQLVRPDSADADRRNGVVVAGDGQGGALRSGGKGWISECAGERTAGQDGRQQGRGQAGGRNAVGPDAAGALVDQTGAGCERRLADQVAAELVDDPLRNAGPSVPGRDRESVVPQPEQLGNAGLAVPGQTGAAGELHPEVGSTRVQVGDLLGAALIEPGDDRRAGLPGCVEQDATLAQPGDPDAEHLHGSDALLGLGHRPAQQPDGQLQQRRRRRLGPAFRHRGPRRPGLDEGQLAGAQVADESLGAGGADVEADDDLGAVRALIVMPAAPRTRAPPGVNGTWIASALSPGSEIRRANRAAAGPTDGDRRVVDHGDRRGQHVRHGEVTEADERDVGSPVLVQGRNHTQRASGRGTQHSGGGTLCREQRGRRVTR